MNKLFTFQRCASALSLLAVTALSQNAIASGYAVRELSVYAQGSAYSGASSSTDSISYMYFNPAMLVHQMGHQVEAGALAIFPHSSVEDASATMFLPVGPGGSIFPVPLSGADEVHNMAKYALTGNFYGLYDLCNDLKFGLSVNSPWGLEDDYGRNKNWVGRFQALHSKLLTVNINPMVSYRVNDEWSVGAGFQAQYMAADLTNKVGVPENVFAGLSAFSPLLGALLGNIGSEPFARVQGYGWGFGFNLGVMYQPWDSTTFGVGYRSQVAHELKHQKSEFLQPAINLLSEFAPTAIPLLESRGVILDIPYKVDASAKVRTPAQLNFGVTHHITDNWAVMADGQWTQWTNLNELRVSFGDDSGILSGQDSVFETEWVNGWWGAIGTSYEYDCHWVFRTGAAYDRSPSRDDALRSPRIPDSDRIWVAVGATYHINYHFSIDASYNHVFVRDTAIHINIDSPQGQSGGTLDANYNRGRVDIIGIDGIYRF